MSKKIIGVTVGTPMKPTKILNITEAHVNNFIKSGSANLLNPKSADVIDKSYITASGTISTASSLCISAKIAVSTGKTYCVTKHSNITNGTLGGIYDVNDNFISNIIGELNADGTAYVFTITPLNSAYIRVNAYRENSSPSIAEYMVVEGTEYPSEYVPFWVALTEDFNLNEKQTEEVKKVITNSSPIKEHRSANLFDHTHTENGYYFTSKGVKTAHSQNSIAYVRLDGAGDYVTKVNTVLFGFSTAAYLPVFDKDKNYIGSVTGVLDDTTTLKPDTGLSATINLEGAYYVGFTVLTSIKQEIMFVKGTEYPSEYIAFEEYSYIDGFKVEPNADVQTNILYGKKISVNGDSICAGAGFTGGYGKIIAERNAMRYQNIGVGGATVTAEQYNSGGKARHWICRTIENMDTDADFAILEGGVNDASVGVPMGEIKSDYKTANWNFDETTFCGAFESMLYQLVTRFAGKKVGYIFVHKMTDNFRSDNADDGTSYYWAAKKCCEKWGVPYLDLNISVPPFGFFKYNTTDDLKALVNTYTASGDGWHPNEEGYKKYYVPKIEAWLKSL